MKPNRKWLWFFAVLVCLTVTAIVVEVWYNLRQQLTSEQLAAARQLWREKGPADYQLEYAIKRQDGSEQRYTVTVQQGKVVAVVLIGGRPLGSGDYPFADVDSLFDHMEKQLEADSQPGTPRVFATAVFDKNNGRILRYIRSVRSPRERIEVIVQMRPLP